ncbi:MAG: insulinase family protein [Candidatus Rokubacteria bacterium]|nr:insulinase family protein [Candidatus Rokubacteria bacterium]
MRPYSRLVRAMAVRTRVAGTVLAAVVMAGCLTARPASQPAHDLSTPKRVVLPNGVTVIVHEHRGADVAAVQLWVRAGSRDEQADELGLAHYLEHMLFKGTPSRPPGFVDAEIERVGGRINAGTSLDYTYYHAVLPAPRAHATIRMLADIAVNASLDASFLENEKRIVLEEMRLHEDNPRRFLGVRLWTLAFGEHPYARPIIGRPDIIGGLSRDTLQRFYRRHYNPDSFALVVVGAVDTDSVIRTATDTFGRLLRTAARRLPPAVAPPAAMRREVVRRPGTHAWLGLAWHAPRLDHAEAPAMALLSAVLGQSRSARLPVALRDRLGIVSSIGAGYSAMEAAGVMSVTAQTTPADVERAEAEIIREIGRLRDGGVTEAELRRAVTTADARHQFQIETAEGRAFSLGRAETIWRMEDELAWVDHLRAVTPEQIKLVARRYLDPQVYARLTVLPGRP